MFGHGQLSLFVVLLSCSLANSADAPQLALHTSHSQTQLRLRNRFAVETPASRLIKGFCTYGLGGVSNIKIRAAIGSHNHEQSRD